jgi:hypothetical protein
MVPVDDQKAAVEVLLNNFTAYQVTRTAGWGYPELPRDWMIAALGILVTTTKNSWRLYGGCCDPGPAKHAWGTSSLARSHRLRRQRHNAAFFDRSGMLPLGHGRNGFPGEAAQA